MRMVRTRRLLLATMLLLGIFAAIIAEAAEGYVGGIGDEAVGFEKYPKGAIGFTASPERVRNSGTIALVDDGHYQDGVLLAKQVKQLGVTLSGGALKLAETKATGTDTTTPTHTDHTATTPAETKGGEEGKDGNNFIVIVIGLIVAILVIGFLAWYLRARE